MKQGIHPDYHPVVFRDRAAKFVFLARSTAASERTITWEDGSTYPSSTLRSRRRATRSTPGMRVSLTPPGG